MGKHDEKKAIGFVGAHMDDIELAPEERLGSFFHDSDEF